MLRRLSESLCAYRPAREMLLPAADHERTLANARIEQYGGIAAIHLAGTPFEMGYQQGVLARDLIHGFRQAAYRYVESQVPLPKALIRPLLFHRAASYWPTAPAGLIEEMRGIAAGAGVHPVEALVSTAIWEIFLASGCSQFAAVSPYTEDGSLIHGYNYDLMTHEHALIQPFLALLFFRPSEGIPFFTVNTVGSVGANAGMNEAGISVAWDNTYLKDKELVQGLRLPVVPFIITLRRLLQYARSIREAVAIVTETLPRPLADIVIIGSSQEGRAVALETAGRRYAIREMQDGAVWSTNCFRSPELAPYDRRGNTRGLAAEAAWQCIPRYMAYTQLFDSCRGQLTPARAAAFLRDPYPREAAGYVYPNPGARATVCREITSWSLIMQPGRSRLWMSDSLLPASQGPFFAFDLGQAQRLPELDLGPTGYHSAMRCAEAFLAADLPTAHLELAKASALDGRSAPLLLMKALLNGLSGDEDAALGLLREVQDSWSQTPMGALAQAWLTGTVSSSLAAIAFPSAIRPLVYLKPGARWVDRAGPGGG